MYTYPNTTQQITRKTTTTTKTYDEEGRLITEETYEEVEYAPTPAPVPNQPWILTNTANTDHRSHVHVRLDGDVRKSDIDDDPQGLKRAGW